MHWLAIIVLAVFAVLQGLAIRRLENRLNAAPRERPESPNPEVRRPSPSEPLWPAPEPSAATRAAEVQAALDARVSVTRTAVDPMRPRIEPPPFRPAPVSPPPPPRPQRAPSRMTWAAVSTWLAENGLAWIGGGGLALGGLLLVVYAAQQGVFTPPLRIASAVVLGGLMIAASEWILRQKRAPGGRHLLAAAVAAGAGAVTLYGAVCAAYALYGLIPFPAAAMLTAAVSLGLLGLALRHGEALALLAVFGAVITPWVTGMEAWSPTVLHAYALLIGVTGFVISAVRLWGRASFVTTAGLLAWSLAEPFGGGAAQLLLAAAGPACAVLWRRAARRDDDPADPRRKVFLMQPAIALVLASVATANLWFDGPMSGAHLPEATLGAGALVLLGAAIVVLGMASPNVFAAPVGMAVLASLLALGLYGRHPGFALHLPWIHGLTALIPVAALFGALRSPPAGRTVLLGVGGVGVALLASLAWPLLDRIGVTLAWTPAAILSGAMFLAAAVIARRVEQVLTDRGLVLWLAAAAELAFLAIHAAVPTHLEPAAFATAALVLAFAAGRLAWPGLAQASVVGGLATLAALFRTDFIGAALEGRLALPVALAVSTGAAALLFLAARLTPSPRAPNRNEAEAQVTASLMVLLAGLFIGLHVILAGADPRVTSDGLFEGALRTVLLLAAGLLLVSRQRDGDGPIARWRTIVVVGAGIVHGLLVQGLMWNPWWGEGAPPVGPPVANTLIVSFLAPAVLLAVCAWRRRPGDGWARAWAAAAALFAVLWAVMTVRHLFQGAAMSGPQWDRAEVAAYAVLGLAVARLLRTERITGASARTEWLARLAPALNWIAVVAAALAFGWYASPWWGPITTPLPSAASALLLFGLYGLGAAGMLGLRSAPGPLGQAATAGTVGVLFALMTLLIRWAFHGGEMSVAAPGGGLETWTFSALWAVFGLAALSLGTARRDVVLRWAGLAVLLLTAAKVMLFDLARLEGVIRAASFLAVGTLLLVGALAARRLSGRTAKTPDPGDAG